MKTVITYGTFDLLHTGHVNLLKRARKLGDRLIVGVTTDSYDQSRGKLNVMESLEERMENVRKTGLADLIIKEELEGQKIHDIRKYGADVFVIGSDWSGKFDYLRDYCEVVYLERTKGVSSTDLRSARNPIVYMGIAGHGRIAGRFLRESKYVSNIEITAVFGRNEEKVRRFAESHALLEYYTEYEQFLDRVHAVYIAVPHHLHYEMARKALLRGKHVLCEKPLALAREEAEELFRLAEEKGVVLLEALKTAFCPAFQQLTSLARSGIIGSIKAVDATFTKLIKDEAAREYDPMAGRRRLDGTGFLSRLCHREASGNRAPQDSFCDLQKASYGCGRVHSRGISLFQCSSHRHGSHRSQAGRGSVHYRNGGVYLCAGAVVEDGDV